MSNRPLNKARALWVLAIWRHPFLPKPAQADAWTRPQTKRAVQLNDAGAAHPERSPAASIAQAGRCRPGLDEPGIRWVYSTLERASIAPERLLRASVLHDLHHSLRAAIGRGNCFHLLFRRFASLSMDQRMNWRRGSPASRLLCERHTYPKSLSVPTGSLSVPVGSDVLRKKLFY